jgi:hypothetical protein
MVAPGDGQGGLTMTMRTTTTSEARTYLRCRQEHQYRYVQGLLRIGTPSVPLAFGTAIHAGLEVYWRTQGEDADGMMEAALRVGRELELDPYELVRVEVMLERYDRQWRPYAKAYEVIGVEERFLAERTGYVLGGKYDALVRTEQLPRRLVVIEHKTTASDIGPGTPYWARLPLDLQVSNYLLASGAAYVLYDVLRKPKIQPRRATPPDRVRMRKDGHPYERTRTEDESLDAWRMRLHDAYDAEPGTWFARQEVVRLAHELVRAGRDMDALGQEIARAHEPGHVAPRNPDACHRYGAACDYEGLCLGTSTVEDGGYSQVTDPHVELT